jgi:hypothetical protein
MEKKEERRSEARKISFSSSLFHNLKLSVCAKEIKLSSSKSGEEISFFLSLQWITLGVVWGRRKKNVKK